MVALLSIGTELTRGELVNTNGPWLAERLADLGHEVTEMTTIDDDDDRIVASLLDLAGRHRFVIVTGGLGPTTDDRTSACAARALGVPLERDARSLARIAGFFERYGLVMQPSNEKQADFPAGALVLDNDRGTAPGFSIELSSCLFFFTPGVPSEMQHLFEERILPRLPAASRPVAVRRLRTYGMPESQVNDLLAGVEEEFSLTIGYRASQSEIEVKVLAHLLEHETRTELEARAESAFSTVRERLGAVVYGEGKTSLPEVLGAILRARGCTLGLAESCTGGLVGELVTSVPGASAYFRGGVTSYSNDAKVELLGVERSVLERDGAVSREVARQMAAGARRVFHADYGLAFTGIAGPDGGSETKPVGLVHFALATPNEILSFERVFRGDREQIRRRAALAGLWALRKAVLG